MISLKNDGPLPFSIKARVKSIGFAIEGMVGFFRSQHNAIIHLAMTILVIFAALFFNISELETIAIVLAAGFVWTAELFNTAVEKLADIVSQEYHPAIKFIKDVSAAAVLVSAVAALITGCIVFLPKIFS